MTDTANATVPASDFGAVPPAVLQRSLFVEPVAATSRFSPPARGAFLLLREEDIVPNGSQVDATRGTLSLFVARTAAGDQINAQVYAGSSRCVSWRGAAPSRSSGSPRSPAARAPATHASRSSARNLAAASGRRRRRRVRVRDRGGRWRTRTGSITLPPIGTRWLTTLRCDGISITVREGRVRVFDRVLRRTRILRRNQTYLARNVRPGRRRVLDEVRRAAAISARAGPARRDRARSCARARA